MPVNPAQLKSLVDQHSAGPSAAALGMAPPDLGPDPDDMGDDDTGDDEAPLDAAGRGAQLIESWGAFGDTIKEEAQELSDLAMDCGPGLLLKDPDEDAIKAVGKSVDSMPDELSMGIAKYVSALPPEDITALATVLATSVGDSADEKLLEAYLTQAGKYAGDEIDVDEDFNVDEDADEEDADADPDDGGDDADAAPPPAGGESGPPA